MAKNILSDFVAYRQIALSGWDLNQSGTLNIPNGARQVEIHLIGCGASGGKPSALTGGGGGGAGGVAIYRGNLDISDWDKPLVYATSQIGGNSYVSGSIPSGKISVKAFAGSPGVIGTGGSGGSTSGATEGYAGGVGLDGQLAGDGGAGGEGGSPDRNWLVDAPTQSYIYGTGRQGYDTTLPGESIAGLPGVIVFKWS